MPTPSNKFNSPEKVVSISEKELLELVDRREIKAAEEKKKEDSIYKKESEKGKTERNSNEYPYIADFQEKLIWLEKEFIWQFDNLTAKIKKEYPNEADEINKQILKHVHPLKNRLPEIAGMDIPKGHIPFIIVPQEELLSLEKEIPLMEVDGKKGYADMDVDEIKNFKSIEGVKIPNGLTYLVVDIETGKTLLGKTPNEAIKNIKSDVRSSLDLKESVALITHHPEILKDHRVWMSGSRRGDRVANLWLNNGKPKLDWHWALYPDAGCGSVSCGSRVGL